MNKNYTLGARVFFLSFLIPDSLRQSRNSEAPSAERKKNRLKKKKFSLSIDKETLI